MLSRIRWGEVFETAMDYATAAAFVLALMAGSSHARDVISATSVIPWVAIGILNLIVASFLAARRRLLEKK